MDNAECNFFAGLPPTLVDEILSKGRPVGDELYVPLREIHENRDKLRGQLKEQDIIQNSSETESPKILTCCGVDGYYAVEKLLSSDLACCAAFAAEGLPPESGKKHWEAPSYSTIYHTDKQYPQTEAVAKAILMQMEIELAASAPHEVIFYNGSFGAAFVTFIETLRLAIKSQQSTVSKEFLKRVKASIDSFKTICDSQSPEKMWVGLPSIEDTSIKSIKDASIKKHHNELVNICNLPEHYDDTTLFTVLLSPGEFTTPKPVEDTELVQIKNLPIKDEKFAEVRDSLVASMSKLHFLYFRPFEWTPAFRVETNPIIAGDSSRYKALLNSIKYQCRTAGISEPYPVFRAGEMAKSFAKAIPALRKSALSHITSLHKDNLGEILPLLIDRANT